MIKKKVKFTQPLILKQVFEKEAFCRVVWYYPGKQLPLLGTEYLRTKHTGRDLAGTLFTFAGQNSCSENSQTGFPPVCMLFALSWLHRSIFWFGFNH